MKSILLLSTFFVLFLSNTIFSQLKIVKDNIACTYGIKNDSGTWVLEPTYILIEELQNGYFKTLTEDGKGVFYQSKHIILNQYDEIEAESRCFKVKKGEKTGIVSLAGQVLVPTEYNGILLDLKTYICYKYLANKYTTTVYSLEGNLIISEKNGIIKPFLAYNHSLIADQISEYTATGNAGLIGIDGKLIIPREYDRLRICNDHLTFVKNNQTGKIDFKNKILLEGKSFLMPIAYDYYGEIPCIDTGAIYKFVENGKYGIMKGNGKLIQPPNIDSIGRSFHEVSSEKTTYIFKSNGKYGFISQDGEITTQAIYEQIIPKPRLNWENNYLKQKKVYFLVVKNNRFGLLDDNGKEQIPCEFNRFYRLDYAKKPNYAISKMNEVFYLDFEKDTLKLQKMTLINEGKIIDLYAFKNEYFAFEISKFEKGKNIISGLLPLYTIGKFIFVTCENKNQLYTLDGKPWTKYKDSYVNFQNGKYALIQTKINSQGLLNVYTGKVILDTNYVEISQHFVSDNLLWAKVQVGEKKIEAQKIKTNQNGTFIDFSIGDNLNYTMVPIYKWIPFDTLGNKLTNATFDKYFGRFTNVITSQNNLKGVVNKDFEWVIPPNFLNIYKYNNTEYLVQTPSKKIGLINNEGKFALDTIFTEIEFVFKGHLSDHDVLNTISTYDYEKEMWIKLKNKESEFLYSKTGVKIDKNNPIYMDKLIFFGLIGGNYFSSAFKLTLSIDEFNRLITDKHNPKFGEFNKAIYEYFKKLFDKNNTCNNFEEFNCFNENIYQIQEIGNHFVSAKKYYSSKIAYDLDYDFIDKSRLINYSYSFDNQNLIWKNQKIIIASLDSIFGKSKLFEEELIAAIKKRDDLKLDCSSTDVLVEKFKQNFELSHKGIYLTYRENTNYYNEIRILIPIENLKKHKQSQWIVEYLK